MPVMRVNKNKNYTAMSNTHLRDLNLSLKARGLLSTILSLPENWNYSIGGLVAICKENESSVKSGLNELKNAGYMVVEKLYSDESGTGKFKYIYNIFENPEDSKELREQIKRKESERASRGENPQVENPPMETLQMEVPQVEVVPLYKYTDELSTDIQNTERLNIDKQSTETINAFTSKEEVKGDIYAFERKSTPQKQEKSALKVPYIDAQNFTWEELHEHIHVRVTKMFQKHGVDDPEKLEELCKIIEYFYRKYDCGWKRYTILSDKALEGIVVKYLYPSYLLAENDVYSFAMYKKMIDKYFNTDFGKNDKNGYGTKVPVELSLPHFMDDAIRESMAMNSLDMTDCIKSVHVDYYE